MHELSLVESLVTALEEIARQEGWGRIQGVRLRLGALRQVVPEVLEFCFQGAIPGTPLAGAALELEEVPALFRCVGCGGEVPLGGRCPACGGPGGEMISGLEWEIVSVDVEEEG